MTSPRELPIEGTIEQIALSLLPDATNMFRLEGKSLALLSPLDRDADDLSSIVLRVSQGGTVFMVGLRAAQCSSWV